MNICYIAIDGHTSHNGGGIASYVSVLGSELAKRGHNVTVISKGKQFSWSEADSVNILAWRFSEISYYLHRLGIFRNLLIPALREIEWSFNIGRALEVVQAKHQSDLVEGCETGNQFLHCIPRIIRAHGAQFTFSKYSHEPLPLGLKVCRRFEVRSLRRASAISTPSKFHANEIGHEISPAKIRIQPIANPIAPWILQESRRMLATPESSAANVLYTGRIERRKGSLVLIESVSYVARRFEKVRYIIAGERHVSISPGLLQKMLKQDGRERYITLLGHVPWQHIASLYQEATIFVMPSYYETFGISCIEAMAFGLPVVATRGSALSEVIEDGVTGFLVPSGDSQALGDAIVHLLLDPQLRKRMGEAGREHVLANYTVEHITDQTLSFYAEYVK